MTTHRTRTVEVDAIQVRELLATSPAIWPPGWVRDLFENGTLLLTGEPDNGPVRLAYVGRCVLDDDDWLVRLDNGGAVEMSDTEFHLIYEPLEGDG